MGWIMKGVVVRTADRAEFLGAGRSSFLPGFRRLDLALFALLIFLLTTGAFVLHAWSRLHVLRLGYEIYQQENERRQLLEENRHLLMEISHLRSPARIGHIAREELGLRPPRADEVVIISRGGQR